jgi:hypothetical protein
MAAFLFEENAQQKPTKRPTCERTEDLLTRVDNFQKTVSTLGFLVAGEVGTHQVLHMCPVQTLKKHSSLNQWEQF